MANGMIDVRESYIRRMATGARNAAITREYGIVKKRAPQLNAILLFLNRRRFIDARGPLRQLRQAERKRRENKNKEHNDSQRGRILKQV